MEKQYQVKKYLPFFLLFVYYLLLIILSILAQMKFITVTFLLFICFSIIDLLLLKKLIKHKVIIFLYTILSYLLCNLIIIIITEPYYSPFIKQINNYFYMLTDFIIKNPLFVLFFCIFTLIKILPCIVILKYIKKRGYAK